MQTESPPSPRETGEKLHRRETWWQITVPFLLGLALLLGMFLLVGLPNNPEWRLRAEAIASLSYSILCLFPVLLCLFIPYILIVLGIYAMRVLHRGTARPLRRLEDFAASLAERIKQFSSNIDDKAEAFDQALAPLYRILAIFDEPEATEEENHESRTRESSES
jgi:hypothetical protein